MLLPVTWLWTATLALVPLDIIRTTLDVNLDPAAQRATVHARYELVVLADGVTLVPLSTGALEVTATRVDGVVAQAQTQDGTTVVTLPAATAGTVRNIEVTLSAGRSGGLAWQDDPADGPAVWSTLESSLLPTLGQDWDVATRSVNVVLPVAWHPVANLPCTQDSARGPTSHQVSFVLDHVPTQQPLHLAAGPWSARVVHPGVELWSAQPVAANALTNTGTVVTTLQRFVGPPPPGTLRAAVLPQGALWAGPAVRQDALSSTGWQAHAGAWTQLLAWWWTAGRPAGAGPQTQASGALAVRALQEVEGEVPGAADGWALLTHPATRALWQQGCLQGDLALAVHLRAGLSNHAPWTVTPARDLGPVDARLDVVPQGVLLRLTPPVSTSWRAAVGTQEVEAPVLDGVSTLAGVTPRYWVVDEHHCLGPDAPRLPLDVAVTVAQQAVSPLARARATNSLSSRPDVLVNLLGKDVDPLVREAAARTLGPVAKTPIHVRALEQALLDPHPRVVAAAAPGLCTQGDLTTARALARVAGAPGDARARTAAGGALGCHVKDAPDLVARALALKTAGGSLEAAVVHGVCGVDANHAVLLDVLRHGGPAAFEAAAGCVLVARQRAAVLGALWGRLQDGSPRVRLAAVAALRRLDAREARTHLGRAATTDTHPDVARAMVQLASEWTTP